jgi:hypothetical protein
VGPVADQVEVDRADAGLKRAVDCAVRLGEAGLEVLHPATDEQRGVIDGQEAFLDRERDALAFELLLDDD